MSTNKAVALDCKGDVVMWFTLPIVSQAGDTVSPVWINHVKYDYIGEDIEYGHVFREVAPASDSDEELVRYVLQYGGFCRECADSRVHGVCDHTGMPCNSDQCRAVIKHALRAWRYGVEHGFIKNPIQERSP